MRTIIGPVRLAYVSVFKPRPNRLRDDELFYEVTLLLPKSPTKHCPDPDGMRKTLEAAFKQTWVDKHANAKANKKTLRDGDEDERFPGYWHMKVSAKADYPPKVVDGRGYPLTNGWGSGDWGKVDVQLFAYDVAGNKGVGASLYGVQFLYKDEPLGSAESKFDVVEDADFTTAPSTQDADDPFADD